MSKNDLFSEADNKIILPLIDEIEMPKILDFESNFEE